MLVSPLRVMEVILSFSGVVITVAFPLDVSKDWVEELFSKPSN
jgi:hypothetical protein